MAEPPNKDTSSAASGFPFSPQDALEFMQRMWNPLGIPLPGFGAPPAPGAGQPQAMPFPHPAALFPALDPAEVDRKIAELRIVENWLTMTLSMMQMSIKTMELQKASLEALRAPPVPPAPPRPAVQRKKP